MGLWPFEKGLNFWKIGLAIFYRNISTLTNKGGLSLNRKFYDFNVFVFGLFYFEGCDNGHMYVAIRTCAPGLKFVFPTVSYSDWPKMLYNRKFSMSPTFALTQRILEMDYLFYGF